MEFYTTVLFKQQTFSLVLVAALSACLPFNGSTPAPATPVTITHPTATASATQIPVTLTPEPTPDSSLLYTPTADCLSRPGLLVAGVADTMLLAKPMRYFVYLPPCYVEEQDRRYPVLYLLHGQTYTEDQWVRLGVPSAADRLIALNEIPPLIIVFPYDYSYLQPREYPFEDVFMQVLIPEIDTAYRTLSDHAQRAVGGLSRGGAWALHLGIRHPDVFGAIGAHSPAVFYSDGSLPVRLLDVPADSLPRIYIDVGDADSELQISLDFKSFLDKYNIPYEWHEYVGFHEEKYWRAHVDEYLHWYTQAWQSNP
jgi:enterochelin esterase-like enzyme